MPPWVRTCRFVRVNRPSFHCLKQAPNVGVLPLQGEYRIVDIGDKSHDVASETGLVMHFVVFHRARAWLNFPVSAIGREKSLQSTPARLPLGPDKTLANRLQQLGHRTPKINSLSRPPTMLPRSVGLASRRSASLAAVHSADALALHRRGTARPALTRRGLAARRLRQRVRRGLHGVGLKFLRHPPWRCWSV